MPQEPQTHSPSYLTAPLSILHPQGQPYQIATSYPPHKPPPLLLQPRSRPPTRTSHKHPYPLPKYIHPTQTSPSQPPTRNHPPSKPHLKFPSHPIPNAQSPFLHATNLDPSPCTSTIQTASDSTTHAAPNQSPTPHPPPMSCIQEHATG